MTDEPDNIIIQHLRAIREDMSSMRGETNSKIEALAASMTSMNARLSNVEDAVNGMRGEIRMIAIAVDGHNTRLDRIEKRLGLDDSPLSPLDH